MKVIADPERDDRITQAPEAPTGSELQRACSAGTLLETDETDVPLAGLDDILDERCSAYTGYLLCLRMLNNSGATSDWVVPAGNAEASDPAPAMAPRPSKDSSTFRRMIAMQRAKRSSGR